MSLRGGATSSVQATGPSTWQSCECNRKAEFLMQTTRRRFIQSGLGCAIGMVLTRTGAMAATRAKTIPIGFQLYTVRGEFSRNAPETLKMLGKIGYKAVEFWGY